MEVKDLCARISREDPPSIQTATTDAKPSEIEMGIPIKKKINNEIINIRNIKHYPPSCLPYFLK
jgi:hypothetical protein